MGTEMEEWVPRGGWNVMFSEQEKIKATHLFFYLSRKQCYPVEKAEVMVHMYLWKQKFPVEL